MITDCRKFTTKITLYGISVFQFYRWNQFSHSPGLYTLYKKPPQIFCDVRRGLTTRQITLTSLSRRQPVTIDYWALSNSGSRQLVYRSPSASSRMLYCRHSTQDSHPVTTHSLEGAVLFCSLASVVVVCDTPQRYKL